MNEVSFSSHLRELGLFLIVLLGPLPLSCALLLRASRDKSPPGFAHSALLLLTGWCLIETCIGLGLGILQHLRWREALITEAMVFLGGAGLCCFLWRQVTSTSWGELGRWRQPLDRWERLVVGMTAFTAALLTYQGMSRLIINYDSLAYHLPAMAKWYQTGSFTMLEQFHGLQSTYPYNWEALCTLFLMPFREDLMVSFPNVVAWGLFGLSIYGVAREIGVNRFDSLAGAALGLHTPIVLSNLNTMHIDLPFAAFFMAGFYYALRYHRTRSWLDWMLFSLSLGMLVGIKMSGLLYAVLLMAALMLMPMVSGRRSQFGAGKLSQVVLRCAITCLSILFIGGFWYVRNYVERGNPLGVVRVQVAGIPLFPGTLDKAQISKTTLAHLFDVTDLPHWQILGGQLGEQLGLPLGAIAGLSFLWLFSLLGGRRTCQVEHLLGIVLLLMGTGWLYWTTPYSGDNGSHDWKITPWIGQGIRYAFPLVGLLCVTSAAGAAAARVWNPGVAAWVLLSGAVALMGVVDSKKMLGGVLLLLMGGLGLGQPQIGGAGVGRSLLPPLWWKAAGVGALVCLLAGGMVGLSWKAREQREARRRRYLGGVMHYITRHVRPNETIGYLQSEQSYVLYGKELNRRVEYVPSNGHNQVEWYEALRSRGVRVVAIGPLMEWMPRKEFGWLEDPRGPFVRVFGQDENTETLLYRFRASRPLSWAGRTP
jgi:hypothetical protein